MKRRNFVAATSSSLVLPALLPAFVPTAALAADPTWQELGQLSLDYSTLGMRELDSQLDFSSYTNWNLHLGLGEIHFDKPGEKPLVAKIQVAGRLADSIWKWGWADRGLDPKITRELHKVRSYGGARRFQKLTEAIWRGKEPEAWLMTLISNFILQGKGVYRAPMQTHQIYMVLTDVRRAG